MLADVKGRVDEDLQERAFREGPPGLVPIISKWSYCRDG
jgi:hypothetical protein